MEKIRLARKNDEIRISCIATEDMKCGDIAVFIEQKIPMKRKRKSNIKSKK